MAILKIQSFLDERQLSTLVEYTAKQLYRSQKSDLEDIDKCFDTLAIRLCVDFAIGLDRIELKNAEILDEDWNTIDADSAVLRSRLRSIIEAYNYSEQELTDNCRSLRHEQLHITPLSL